MKRIFYHFVWIWWRITGYRELSELLRQHSGNWNALTPKGLELMKALGEFESEIRRKMIGIQK